MKNIFGKPVVLFVIALATLCACKKNKDENKALTVENLAGSYKLVKIMFQPQGTTAQTDVTEIVTEECERDDVATLSTNKTYLYVDGGTVCAPDNSATGTWDLPGNNKFQVTIDTDVKEYDVVSFDGTTLVLSYTDNFSGFDGTAYVYQQKH